jgi:ABC-2 type transport system permease protein
VNVLADQVYLLARRSVVRTVRQPANVIAPLVFPMLLLAVNSGGLKAETRLPGFPTNSFIAFALAVPFIQGALFATMNAGTDLARDIQTGFLSRLSLTPMRSIALLAGQLGGVVALGVVQAAVYLSVGLIVGVRLASGLAGVLVIFAFAVLVSLGFGALGAFAALRTGSSEAVQSLFPAFFVFLFLSSMNIPRNLIEVTWFRDVATVNPVSYLLEGVRSLIIIGWDGEALALGFGIAAAITVVALLLASWSLRVRMRSFAVARAVAWRTLHNVFTNPSLFVPSLLFPLFFFTAFAGGLSRVSDVPGFDYSEGYTAFQFVFVLLQSAAFGGVFTGFGIARDFESGFARRLLLAAPNRTGIVLGYAAAALGRWLATATILTVIALAVGMHVGGSGVDLFGLYTLAALLNIAAVFWAAGVAMRLRTMQAGPIMQLPVFLVLFFAPVYVPLTLLSGWIHAIAVVNPVTRVVEAGRGFLAGTPTEVAAAFGAAVLLAAAFAWWAVRGLRRAEAAGA